MSGLKIDSKPLAERDEPAVSRAIVLAQHGNPEGVQFLYHRFGPDVLGYVAGLLRDHHEAEDVMHNVFAKLLRNIGSYDPERAVFRGWLLRVARNTAFDHLRARRPIPQAEPLGGASADAVDTERHGPALRTALGELPVSQREVVFLRHFIGLSAAETAVVLGRTESSVNSLQNRGRQRLKTSLRNLGAAPAVLGAARGS